MKRAVAILAIIAASGACRKKKTDVAADPPPRVLADPCDALAEVNKRLAKCNGTLAGDDALQQSASRTRGTPAWPAVAANCRQRFDEIQLAKMCAATASVTLTPVDAGVPDATELAPDCRAFERAVAVLSVCQPSLASSLQQTLQVLRSGMTPEGTCRQAVLGLKGMTSQCPALAQISVDPNAPVEAPIDAGVPPIDGSREVAAEVGVPFDQAALGPLPHPFGVLETLRTKSTRDEILSALPNARRDGDFAIKVPLGVERIIAKIDIDRDDHLDVVRVPVDATQIAMLDKAWGKRVNGTWFDRTKHWRADLEKPTELVIGPYVPLAEQLGKGPDGLADPTAVIGMTVPELEAHFGKRFSKTDLEVTTPATEHCMYFTYFHVVLEADRVAAIEFAPCVTDETSHAALGSLESVWGRAQLARVEDRPVFEFDLPARRVILERDENAWHARITKR